MKHLLTSSHFIFLLFFSSYVLSLNICSAYILDLNSFSENLFSYIFSQSVLCVFIDFTQHFEEEEMLDSDDIYLFFFFHALHVLFKEVLSNQSLLRFCSMIFSQINKFISYTQVDLLIYVYVLS